ALLAAVALGAGELFYHTQAAESQQPPKAEKPAAREENKAQAARKPIVAKDNAQLVHVAWGPDGKTVATLGLTGDVVESKNSGMKLGLASHTIKLWDAASGKLEQSLGEEKDVLVQSITFSLDKQTGALITSKVLFDRAKGEQTAKPETEVRL